jgi:HEAT repeat protein
MAETNPDPRELVARLACDEGRWAVQTELLALGPAAREAVLEGLRNANWQVRRWCALWFDHFADAESLEALVPLLRDPKSQVRLFAVHSLACETCKPGVKSVDVVPLLIERVRSDESIRVRRHAVVMLAHQHAHPHLEGFFRDLIDTETDMKLRKHAGYGIWRCRGNGPRSVRKRPERA